MIRLPPWSGWFVLRLLSGAATTLVLSLVVFAATQALPSDPARVILGPDATDESVAILTRQLGLDRPILEQYSHWLSGVASGDLGRSLSSRRPVAELVGDRIVGTLTLVGFVMPLGLLISVVLGVVLAVHRDSWLDRVGLSLLIGVKAVPVFATGIALVLLFSTAVFSWFPAVSLLDPERSIFVQLELIALPCATLLISSVPYLARLVRTAMIEALASEYVLQARLRGVPERRLLYLHALPNAIIPVIQGSALTASVMLGGGLVVEVLFNYPGLGSLLHQAVETRDLPIVQAAVLVVATFVVLVNLAADLLSLLLTPRLRTRARTEAKAAPSARSLHPENVESASNTAAARAP